MERNSRQVFKELMKENIETQLRYYEKAGIVFNPKEVRDEAKSFIKDGPQPGMITEFLEKPGSEKEIAWILKAEQILSHPLKLNHEGDESQEKEKHSRPKGKGIQPRKELQKESKLKDLFYRIQGELIEANWPQFRDAFTYKSLPPSFEPIIWIFKDEVGEQEHAHIYLFLSLVTGREGTNFIQAHKLFKYEQGKKVTGNHTRIPKGTTPEPEYIKKIEAYFDGLI